MNHLTLCQGQMMRPVVVARRHHSEEAERLDTRGGGLIGARHCPDQMVAVIRDL